MASSTVFSNQGGIMTETVEISQEMHDELNRMAEAVARDISADFPGHDTSFDLWIESFVSASYPKKDIIYGVIDMGDLFQQAYEWDGGEWHYSGVLDVYELIEHILRKRRA